MCSKASATAMALWQATTQTHASTRSDLGDGELLKTRLASTAKVFEDGTFDEYER